MKYPIGIQSFENIIENGYVYVDKTDLVYSLANEGKIYFLSRPRRFGKSLLISTLKNYFLGRKDLFKGLKIEDMEKNWFVYPVFHIDFNGGEYTLAGALRSAITSYIKNWEKEYEIENGDQEENLGFRFKNIIEAAHKRHGRRAVVLIDEYDKPILDVLDINKELEEEHRNILKGFYSTFKAADEHLQFVFLTGVTKFSQVSVFSGFNQPFDISMFDKYDTLCGISQDEIDEYFSEPIEEMSRKYKCSYIEMRSILKSQYDGYHFSESMNDIYNPFSLLSAFATKKISDYWFGSGTPSYLIRLLSHTNENINEITGKYYRQEEFVDYKADVEKPLPMIYQSGYLTIKGYEMFGNRFLLDFPNNEVKNGFLTMIATSYFQTNERMTGWVFDVINTIKSGDIEKTGELFSSFLSSIPYTMRRKKDEREKERYFQYTFYLLMRLISVYTIYIEKVQSRGRVDCIIETSDYIYIFEFKLDGTADEALRQIEEKGYALEYKSDKRKIYKIGAVFSSCKGTIEEWKVI